MPPCATVSTQQEHERTAQRRINANAKTCKCELMALSLGFIYKSQTDSRVRGSLASIALPRKF
eukprot:2820745-Pleurochrysis_carterae.AAC.1